MNRGFGSMEFLVALIIIAVGAIFFWFWWYVPAQNKITIGMYKSAMNMTRGGIALCKTGEGKIRSGLAGEKMCGDSIFAYPEIPAQCGAKPYFSASQKKEKWSVTTLSTKGGAAWDCLGCRLECGEEKCEQIGDCED